MKNLKISLKLYLLVSLFGIILLFIGINGIIDSKNIDDHVETMYHDRVIPLKQLKTVSDKLAIDIVDLANKVYLEQVSRSKASEIIAAALNQMTTEWNKYLKTNIVGNELTLSEDANNYFPKVQVMINEFQNMLRSENFEREQIKVFIEERLYQTVDPFTEKISSLIDIQLNISEKLSAEAKEIYIHNRNIAYIIIIAGILLGAVFSALIIRGIRKSLQIANNIIATMTKGDLTVSFPETRADEIGKLLKNFENMSDHFKSVVSTVTMASHNIAEASIQLSENSQEISQGASEQASSVEEVSSSIQQMASNIEQNTDNAKKTESIAKKAEDGILTGSEKVNSTVDAMKQIAEKISIIGDIAFQTNILALNAAVEAARAGEHGKGFGVVAAEVGKLAERSKLAAAEIDEITKTSVMMAEETCEIMGAIVPDIQKTSVLVQEITAASMEQNSGANQISDAIQQLNEVTQQNAASSEEMATSAEELNSQADQLQETISFFKIESVKKKGRKTKQTKTERKALKAGSLNNKKANSNNYDSLDKDFEQF